MAQLTEETGKEIVRKLDILLDAMGLSANHSITPVEAESIANGIVLQFQKKRGASHDSKASN